MVTNLRSLFSTVEKLTIAQLLLEELNVDRIEILCACEARRISRSKGIMAWASTKGYENRIEVLTFVDRTFYRMDEKKRG
jgi:D-citramalate synthase